MTGQEMANETFRQLGGTGRLAAMIGANNFGYSSKDGSIQFNFKSCRKANVIKVEVTPADLYKVTFYKYNRRTYETATVKEFDGLYNDQLKETIEDYTGLYLSL
jgi:hypothetical protein